MKTLMLILICSWSGQECDVATVSVTQKQCESAQEQSKTNKLRPPSIIIYCLPE